MSDINLLSCPFCGGEPRFESNVTDSFVRCESCGARLDCSIHPGVYTNHEAMKRAEDRTAKANWNKRSDLELRAKETEALGYLRAVGELQAEVRKLEKALEKCVDALSRCYDVCDWPADGKTVQDEAIRAARAALTEAKGGGEG